MKKQIPTILVIVSVLTFASCGPNQAELDAREKAKMDSVSLATTNALLATQKQDSIAAKEQMEAKIKATADSLVLAIEASMQNEDCKEMRAMLAVAEHSLEDIKQFKLLRTAAEKEQQLTEQYRLIEELKDHLKKCD